MIVTINPSRCHGRLTHLEAPVEGSCAIRRILLASLDPAGSVELALGHALDERPHRPGTAGADGAETNPHPAGPSRGGPAHTQGD